MFVILVYDTLAERNPGVLKTCRKYLHWVQRSVFEGQLTAAQYRTLTWELKAQIDPGYDSVRTTPPGRQTSSRPAPSESS